MSIILPRDQQKWLEDQVSAGHFSSVEEAVAIAISDLRSAGADDLSWAKPYVDAARESLAAGDMIEGDDFIAELDRIIVALKTP